MRREKFSARILFAPLILFASCIGLSEPEYETAALLALPEAEAVEGPAISLGNMNHDLNGCSVPHAGYKAILTTIFSDACARHDNCYQHGYATYGYSRTKCDDDFYRDLKDTCGWEPHCRAIAWIMYEAVDSFGESSFKGYRDIDNCDDYRNKPNEVEAHCRPNHLVGRVFTDGSPDRARIEINVTSSGQTTEYIKYSGGYFTTLSGVLKEYEYMCRAVGPHTSNNDYNPPCKDGDIQYEAESTVTSAHDFRAQPGDQFSIRVPTPGCDWIVPDSGSFSGKPNGEILINCLDPGLLSGPVGLLQSVDGGFAGEVALRVTMLEHDITIDKTFSLSNNTSGDDYRFDLPYWSDRDENPFILEVVGHPPGYHCFIDNETEVDGDWVHEGYIVEQQMENHVGITCVRPSVVAGRLTVIGLRELPEDDPNRENDLVRLFRAYFKNDGHISRTINMPVIDYSFSRIIEFEAFIRHQGNFSIWHDQLDYMQCSIKRSFGYLDVEGRIEGADVTCYDPAIVNAGSVVP